jgi:hypothetical protein
MLKDLSDACSFALEENSSEASFSLHFVISALAKLPFSMAKESHVLPQPVTGALMDVVARSSPVRGVSEMQRELENGVTETVERFLPSKSIEDTPDALE